MNAYFNTNHLAGLMLLVRTALLWRIRIEESALMTTLGDGTAATPRSTSASSRSSGNRGQSHD